MPKGNFADFSTALATFRIFLEVLRAKIAWMRKSGKPDFVDKADPLKARPKEDSPPCPALEECLRT
jgi:hypothetical protein